MTKITCESTTLSISGTREGIQKAVAWLFDNVQQFDIRHLEIAADEDFPEYDGAFSARFYSQHDAALFKVMFAGL